MTPSVRLFENRTHPRVLWFVLEGVLIGLAGFLVWVATGPDGSLNVLGTVAMAIGAATAVIGILGYGVLVLIVD